MRTRLTAAFLSIILLMLLIQDVPLFNYLNDMEHAQIYTSLERDAWRLASQTGGQVQAGQLDAIQQEFAHYVAEGDPGARVVVTDETGKVLVSSDNQDLGNDYTNRPEVSEALAGRATTGERASVTLGDNLIYAAVPVTHETTMLGALRISYPGATIANIVNNRVRGLLIVGLMTLAITVGATIIISNTITYRLRKIQQATTEVAAGNLGVRLFDPREGPGAPEVRKLEQTFDNMLERLSGVLDSQRAFASDASHQLRTPLTALRLKLENAGATIDDPEKAAEALDQANQEVVRLQTLVDGLLALARLEGSNPKLEPLDVSQIALSRISIWEPLADERNIKLLSAVQPNLIGVGTALAVEQILDAYLDNALDFAPREVRSRSRVWPHRLASSFTSSTTDRACRRPTVSAPLPAFGADDRMAAAPVSDLRLCNVWPK